MTTGGTSTAGPQSRAGCGTGRFAYDGLLQVDEGDRVQMLCRLRDVEPPGACCLGVPGVVWKGE